jgi:hypothetical protein
MIAAQQRDRNSHAYLQPEAPLVGASEKYRLQDEAVASMAVFTCGRP